MLISMPTAAEMLAAAQQCAVSGDILAIYYHTGGPENMRASAFYLDYMLPDASPVASSYCALLVAYGAYAIAFAPYPQI